MKQGREEYKEVSPFPQINSRKSRSSELKQRKLYPPLPPFPRDRNVGVIFSPYTDRRGAILRSVTYLVNQSPKPDLQMAANRTPPAPPPAPGFQTSQQQQQQQQPGWRPQGPPAPPPDASQLHPVFFTGHLHRGPAPAMGTPAMSPVAHGYVYRAHAVVRRAGVDGVAVSRL